MQIKNFYDHLEYHISAALEEFSKDDERLKGYWCDGVVECAETNSLKQVWVDGREILKAFAGKNGQGEYKLILKFDDITRSHIEECNLLNYIPINESKSWFNIDVSSKIMEIQFKSER